VDLVLGLVERLNSLAGAIGAGFLGAFGLILPVALPRELGAPIGWLALLTLALAAGEVARKFTWVIVGIGWLLIAIRIVLVVIRT
jgi:hypothetical protein